LTRPTYGRNLRALSAGPALRVPTGPDASMRMWNDKLITVTNAHACAIAGDVVSQHERHGSTGDSIR
jgi:hypothetical protein